MIIKTDPTSKDTKQEKYLRDEAIKAHRKGNKVMRRYFLRLLRKSLLAKKEAK